MGGAELSALELLEQLARHHQVRAVWLDGGLGEGWRDLSLPDDVQGLPAPAPQRAPGYWTDKARRREALGLAVADAVSARRPDALITQLHGAPAAWGAASRAGVPTVVLLPSYESLCKHAFAFQSDCAPARDCTACSAARRLEDRERASLLAARRANERVVEGAAALVANSDAVAAACRRWSGREAAVVAPVYGRPAPPARSPSRDGHALLSAARWSRNKGLDRLPALATALAPRRVVVTEDGLGGCRAELERLSHVALCSGEASELLAGAAVALVPARWEEPFGRVAFEALCAGVPVVASKVGGLADYVPEDGLMAPDEPVEAWVGAVSRVTAGRAWAEAASRAVAAGRSVLAARGVEHLEGVLARAAAHA